MTVADRKKAKTDPFPHSPIIYGDWVETFGPYSQNYMRDLLIHYEVTFIVAGFFSACQGKNRTFSISPKQMFVFFESPNEEDGI
ncbi:hypothetical protein JCM12214_25900 [Geobacillus vulcani]